MAITAYRVPASRRSVDVRVRPVLVCFAVEAEADHEYV